MTLANTAGQAMSDTPGFDAERIQGTLQDVYRLGLLNGGMDKVLGKTSTVSEAMATITAAVEEAEINAKIRAKKQVLQELIMGSGEYHDDPTEYVVRNSELKERLWVLERFDLNHPIFREQPDTQKGTS